MSWLSSLFGGGKDETSLPAFKADPYVAKTQDYMFPYASSLLEGKVPDYYKSIGEWGGSDFDKMMALTTRDTANAANENLVRRGISRGGLGADITAKAVGDAATKLSWADFNRAMQGRQWLMGEGANMMGGVRNAALTNQSQENSYAMNLEQLQNSQDQQENAGWSNMLSSGVGVLGNLFGINMMKDVFNPSSGAAPSSASSDLGAIDVNSLLNMEDARIRSPYADLMTLPRS